MNTRPQLAPPQAGDSESIPAGFDDGDYGYTDMSTVSRLQGAEIEQQIKYARVKPRNIGEFTRQLREMATSNLQAASECLYRLPRDGKTIEGPTIRFAELLVIAWGNCRVGARVIEESHDFIVAQGVFQDLERNITTTQEIRRRIVGRGGRRYSLDMIGMTANAACSIALRNAIIRGVPRALWSHEFEQVKAVLSGGVEPFDTRRKRAVDTFAAMGVTQQQILDTLKIAHLKDLTTDHLLTLGGIIQAVNDQEAKLEEIFEPVKSATDKLKDIQNRAQLQADNTPLKTGMVTTPHGAKVDANAPPAVQENFDKRAANKKGKEENRKASDAAAKPGPEESTAKNPPPTPEPPPPEKPEPTPSAPAVDNMFPED